MSGFAPGLPARLGRMLRQADLFVCARDGDRPAGVPRALTDFSSWRSLSDLAVDVAYQPQSIGQRLIGGAPARGKGRSCRF